MSAVNLTRAAELAPDDVETARCSVDPALFDEAMAHHTARQLRANLANGTTRDASGWRSGFVAYDGADTYAKNPHWIWHDFFKGAVMNSVSRMSRGLTP